ncbi:MAG: ABC transporter ATP-binding protein [Devosia sp.]
MVVDIARKSSRSSASPPPPSALVALRGVGKTYKTPAGDFAALSGIDLDLSGGEFLAVVGKSGSGKTTLANLLTGIDSATSGSIRFGDTLLNGKSEEELTAWRGRTVGVVFQFFQLLPTLTIAENVMLPMDFCHVGRASERRPRAMSLLERLGIADQADKLPVDLSGGQQQRAAIARALANDPMLVVADEPTGNLDSRTAREVMDLFRGVTEGGRTVIMVTHERDLASYFTRTIELADGRIVSDATREAAQ